MNHTLEPTTPVDVIGTDAARPNCEVVAKASALIPLIREYAEQSSADRRVAPEVMAALKAQGLFKVFVPRRYGGYEENLATAIETIAEVARGNGSTAWVVALLNLCTWFATTFAQEAQDEVFGANPDATCCGIFTPFSKTVRVDGGYMVSGQWPYSSGWFGADWATVGLSLDVEDENHPALALIPKEAWTINPTWFVAGMQGSGSDTIVVEDHFVPDHRVQRFVAMRDANFATPHKVNERNSNMAFIAVTALILVGAQLGLARHAMELTLQKLPNKAVAYTKYTAAKNSPTHQIGVAVAATKFNLAELLMRQATADVDNAAARGELPDLITRGRIRSDAGIVAELVKDGIDILMTTNGAGSFADANALSQIWRDAEIAGRHAFVSPEVGKEVYGRLLIGADDALTMDV
ncbi:acyl-CoA dehydrogenase family protein [Mycobacterium montefiorense]|uniref:Acyl-CoA dehydrogenase n=1 Tax=Mycobacterium montefiorense TaxID=154654 RepID=A0AA37PKJ0_9MYCO|nr:acyl-CoA dehydrogenase family protein [Mycobacterium montefiorense]GBG39239.1 acyl-CoA dehydrogenase [Mycobacterium montefiorense]GKU37288.1 acyl-CoA dehydrogenase [Mycobacterium montefiorense]GKU41936.1 acyl-CoA dehydrogenase [Mycobacterium montefiorense]GKU45602.1 acyl-CoA dehydrogenase [Mycobacterium montefiorense]GKU53436.1 acyl-CoA dehydrogenase [Mycobacterium montefiorense]